MSTYSNLRWFDESRRIVLCEKDGQACGVPAQEANPDWQAIQGAGLAIADHETPPVGVPPSVKMWQARAILETMGHLATVDAALAAMPGAAGVAARAAWKHAPDISRNSPVVLQMGALLQLDSAALDQLFMQADALRV